MDPTRANNEKNWSAALKSAKRGLLNSQAKTGLDSQKKNLGEEITHYKSVLRAGIVKNNQAEIKRALKELFKRRAKLAVLNLLKHEEKNLYVSQEAKDKEMNNYFIQCGKLIQSAALLARYRNGNKQTS